MASVDPPVIQWPRKWLEDPEIGPVVVWLNRFLHDSWIKNGGADDVLAVVSSDTNRKADTLLYAVLDKVSLGDELTTDTTGFTTDSTVFTTDMTES